jgi:hypothetical protein
MLKNILFLKNIKLLKVPADKVLMNVIASFSMQENQIHTIDRNFARY